MKTCIVWIAAIGSLLAQVAKEANERYQTPEGRAAVAKGLIASDRDARQKPVELVAHMNLKPGMVVADVGTGAGYMLPFLSKAVGAAGKVLAQDIQDDFLAQAKKKAEQDQLGNILYVKGTATDPMLPEGGVDVALTLDAYHHYDYPEKMLAGLRKALKPGGRLVIVDYYKRPAAMSGGRAMQHIRLDSADVIKEVTANGFTLVSEREHIKDSQFMAIFTR
jgi:ubiquinone/menaquinone biosynthesis C-methylase UbiE